MGFPGLFEIETRTVLVTPKLRLNTIIRIDGREHKLDMGPGRLVILNIKCHSLSPRGRPCVSYI